MWLNETLLAQGRELCIQEGMVEEIMILASNELKWFVKLKKKVLNEQNSKVYILIRKD